VSRAFSARTAARLRERTAAIADELLDDLDHPPRLRRDAGASLHDIAGRTTAAPARSAGPAERHKLPKKRVVVVRFLPVPDPARSP
jgi:hypothetical protein